MSDEYQGGHPDPVNLWERGGQSPDARPDKRPISRMFTTTESRITVFTGSRVSFASGANGQMAVNIEGDPASSSQQFGSFGGYPWIAYALNNPSAPTNGFDVAQGNTAIGNSGTPQPIASLSLLVQNPNDATKGTLLIQAGGSSTQGSLIFGSGAAGDSLALQLSTTACAIHLKQGNNNEVNILAGTGGAGSPQFQMIDNVTGGSVNFSTSQLNGNGASFILLTIGGVQYYVLAAPGP
jgi:hypothetical protein